MMENISAGMLLTNVAQFNLNVDRLYQYACNLWVTGSPRHLPAIKDITKKLIGQIVTFKAQLEVFERSPENQHLTMLIKECEHGGFQLLGYLYKLVAHAQRLISHRSNKAIKVKFEWTYIQDLVNKLKGLRISLEDTTLIVCHGSKRSTQTGLPTPPPEIKGSWLSKTQNNDETQTGIASPGNWRRDQPSESLVYDYLSTTILSPDETLVRRPQSLLASRQGIYQWMLEKLSPGGGSEATQILWLYHEWRKVFRQRPLPALVLSYAIESSGAALSGPIALERVSDSLSLQSLEQRLVHCCHGLLGIRMLETRSQDALQGPDCDSEINRLVVSPANDTAAEVLESGEVRIKICESTTFQGYDPLSHLASACLMILKSADVTRDNMFHRYLVYLAHILRHAPSLSGDKIQLYLDVIRRVMMHFQSTAPSKTLPLSIFLQPINSLHLQPELRCYTTIHTFAAQEALPIYPHIEFSDEEPRHRFSVTAHALSSWTSRLNSDHPLKMFEPSLQRRKSILRHLLTNLTPPESTVCGGRYSLLAEAVRLCNTGAVKEPVHLLAIFLAASTRPDLLWEQIFRPLLGTGFRSRVLLDVLKAEVESAVAPDLLMLCIKELEQRDQQSRSLDRYDVRR